MVFAPSHGLKGALIRGGLTNIKIKVFIDPQIKSAQDDHTIGIIGFQH